MTRTSSAFCLALLLAACGGDSSGPAGPQSLQISSGNPQTGPAGGNPPLALRVVVTGSGGQPFQGAQVAWQVTAGGGSVSPASSTTDANGQATSVVTLGPTEGVNSIRATVGSLAPVTFQITSVPPCDYLAPFREDTTVTGALRTSDCNFGDGSFVDFYDLVTNNQRTLEITMQATSLNAFLWLFDITGPGIGFDNNGGGGTNSRLKAILRPGQFVVGANSLGPGEVGAYTVAAAPVASTVSLCEDVWVSGSVTVTETIATTDCRAAGPVGGTFFYSDGFLLILFPGDSVTVRQTSTAVDAYLSLYLADSAFTRVAWSDTGGGGTNAQLGYRADTAFVYILDAGTASVNETGNYMLQIDAITNPAPPFARALGLQAAPHQRLDLPRARLGRPLRRR